MSTTFDERQIHRRAFLERFAPPWDEWSDYDHGITTSKAFHATPEPLPQPSGMEMLAEYLKPSWLGRILFGVINRNR